MPLFSPRISACRLLTAQLPIEARVLVADDDPELLETVAEASRVWGLM